MLEFNVLKGQYLNRLDKNVVSADTTDLKASFELTADFTGTITVWWRRSDVNNTYTSTLAADGTCTIPAEALAATDKAVYGPYDHDVFVSISDTGRTTTNEYKLTVQRSAFSTNATPGTGGSPTAYEELVEQFDELKADNQTFKDNMTEQQETFENTVTENVRYVVETETAPPIIEEASGAEITLDDSAYRQVRGLQLYGYSRQTQTTGAQLLDYNTLSGTQNGITPSIDDDNYIVLNGTATANAFIYVLCNIPSGTSMFISVNNPILNNNISVYIKDEESTYSSEYIALDTANKTHAFASVSVAISRFAIRVVQGTTLTNFRLRPMLNAGTSALPWEPYSGGHASPSPDWAQPIHSAADEVNLLDESLFTQAGAVHRFIHIQTDAESVTVSSNTPRTSTGSAYIQAIPGNVSSIEGITTSTNGVYAGQSRTISTSDGYITIVYFLNGIGNENINFSDYWVMVNAGDTALSYRPYGHNVTVESRGTNLIDVSKSIGGFSTGITVKALGDGTFSYSGTATAGDVHVWLDGAWDSTKELIHLRGGEYTAFYDEAIYVNHKTTLNYGNKIEAPSNGVSVTGVRAPSTTKGTYYNKIIYPMISRGSTPIPWQPYVAPSSALIALTDSLRGIPVSSGGNYTDESGQQWIADYIYRRQTDGKWMIWRNCGRVEYIGGDDENWTYEGAYFRFTTSSGVSNALVVDGRSMVICNRGLYHQSGVGTGYTFIAGGPRFYYSPDSGIDSVDSLKTWLQSNPLEVVYQLATPTIEELPENVQTELNGLYTYNLHTDMWNNDGAYMGLKYVADTKTWINNKIAGLSTAMLNQN